MKLTFRIKIFIYFVVIILITSIPISLITYNYMYNSLKNDLYSNTKSQMLIIDDNFSNAIRKVKEDVKLLANLDDVKKVDKSIIPLFNIPNIEENPKYSKQIKGVEGNIYKDLENYGTTHDRTTYVYVGTKWGGYVQWPDGLSVSTFDPRKRPWYAPAIENPGKVSISEPYVSAIDNSNNVIITASTTIADVSENIVGVMGIDISLDHLSNMIKDIKVGDNGYIFLFSRDGTILAHPDSSMNFKNISVLKPEAEESDKNYKELVSNFDNLIIDDNGKFETIIDGKDVFVNVYTSPYTGWKIASVVEKTELINKADRMRDLISAITIFSLLFAIGLSYIVSKRITRPITELTPLMNAAGKGDLSVKANITANDEFGELGRSFNLMIGQLSANYDELAAVYEELLATEEALRAQYDELSDSEEALRNSEERYKLALECANDSIWEWDLKTGEFFVSDKLYDISGYILDKDVDIISFMKGKIHPEDVDNAFKDIQDHINNLAAVYKSEFRFKKNNGEYVWLLARGMALRDLENKAIKLAGSITDISYRKLSEEKIKFMAYYDSLTKLPNRTFFINKLNELLEPINNQCSEGAVLFIDLDNFKIINDTLGHNYGDKLLIYLAEKFENWINEEDIICRLGGDEFILLHPNANEAEVKSYAQSFLELFNQPCKIDGKQIYVTVSIGITLYPKDGIDADTILKNADAAMYKAKELGKNRFELFNPDMYLKLERKMHIERILRTAIENDEFIINYQPQYDAENNKIFGFEALLRLISKELGFISPLEFIPIAEEYGYITKIGQWVIKESCKQAVKWIEKGYNFKSISVNISSVDLQQPNFIEYVEEIINSTGIDPKILELEITETVLMESFDFSIIALKQLMDMGIRIALDDFGTGYSSLSYLRKIPINTLKIDKSFIDNITSNQKEESIINSIIEMAHSFELKVVAEGVETKEQLSVLEKRKCDYIQGYYFSKPLPSDDIEKLFEKGNE
ncbi:EAL domain-containing protein [Clostridium sp. C2-6-12]|uniref:bifunctional diguanylate cyclase/phosphodiesterase n=1 Tax=Clostridium sp. C2-6-12 TaxID=2698832 RepID=UPI001370CF45|nr:EAL domain-containing protein [Clostridium sp. C2-6-12]